MTRTLSLAAATLLSLLAGNLAAQASRPAINLLTRSRIEIARPAAAIWPAIVDPSAWKAGATVTHHSGPPGQVGEVFAARLSAGDEPAFLLENVELIPAQRRTIKLYQPDGRLLGYATWYLIPSGTGTVVGYDVYSETLVPAGTLSAEAILAQEREVTATNQRRFDSELVALKRLVESGR